MPSRSAEDELNRLDRSPADGVGMMPRSADRPDIQCMSKYKWACNLRQLFRDLRGKMTTSLLRSLAGGVLLTGMSTSAVPAPAQTLHYPPARKSDVVDDYHGTRVPDPYRWLEDPDSPESRAWIEAQNRLTEAYLAAIPARATLRDRLTKLWNYPKYGAPFRKAQRYFFFKNDGLQNQSVLYQQASLTAQPETLLDPNLLSADGTVALSTL